MLKQITFYEFSRAFHEEGYGEHFSPQGLKALFEYIEDCYNSGKAEYTLDVSELCEEFGELSLHILLHLKGCCLEELKGETTVLELEGGRVVFQAF